MTGDTIVCDEKNGGDKAASPTISDDSAATAVGDAIIEIPGYANSTAPSSMAGDAAQPPDSGKKPTVLRRITGSFKSTPDPIDVTETNTRKLENTPNGFPRLAAFQSSEANFSLYRSFSYLHSRVLLDLQDEIRTLESELDEKDWDDFDENPDRLRSRDIDISKARTEGTARNRRVILAEIRTKLMEYDDVLIKTHTLESFQRPSTRNYRSVRRYHHNHAPLMDSETDSIRSREDTISLRNGREWANFDGSVEVALGGLDTLLQRILRTKAPPMQNWFRTKELREKTGDQYVAFYSSERIDKLINVLITFVIFVLLVIPVLTMYHLTSTPSGTLEEGKGGDAAGASSKDTFNAVGVLIVFTLLFSAAMSLLTKAARHELFAASAAYCAILVVFIGNFTGPGS
ncbi:hypothetical protein EJ04DRAFT_440336 [Polyplosphaeria fusca]|uniref:DUF6594 domain-containing protein n=1 Tax=Polyplosphaeria fusca TaxID=682080 RepID=A0A9P4QUR7_9PLEO|nr:hypothetical protein EJ04DRAFT_440336 [Polyplosphaeria fusca]